MNKSTIEAGQPEQVTNSEQKADIIPSAQVSANANVVRCAVTHQGAPIINEAVLYKKSKDIACIQIDCRSKYCEVDAHFSGSDGECGIYIGANERSLHLKKDVDRDEPTGITFPEFVGWYVFATSSGRYTISVCLVKVA